MTCDIDNDDDDVYNSDDDDANNGEVCENLILRVLIKSQCMNPSKRPSSFVVYLLFSSIMK